MAELYQCDHCKQQTTQPLSFYAQYERTPEEVSQLLAGRNLTEDKRTSMRSASKVEVGLDLCRKCFDELRSGWLQ